MMKVVLFLACCFMSPNGLTTEPVPGVVQDAFDKMYPLAIEAFWEKREGALVANFQGEEGLTKVFFDDQGTWLETRIRKDFSEMPAAVQRFVNAYYSTADITFAGKMFRNDEVLYRIESELNAEVVIKLLDENGGLVEENRITLDIPLEKKEQILSPAEVDRMPIKSLEKLSNVP